MKKGKLVVIAAIFITMAVFVGVAIKNKPQTEDTIGGYKDGKRVQVEYIKTGNIQSKISSSGKLEAVDTKTVYLEATNKVIQLHKKIGDTVEKGEVVITLDQEAKTNTQNKIEGLKKQLIAEQEALNELQGKGSQADILSTQASILDLQDKKKTVQQSIEEAKKNIETLNRDLSEKQKDLETTRELFEEGLAAQKEVDDLQDAIDDLKQEIEKAESSNKLSEESLSTMDAQIKTTEYKLALLENKVEDPTKKAAIATRESNIKGIQNQIAESENSLSKEGTEILAPIKGVITYQPDEEGMTIAAGSPLLTIVDPSTLKVECNISPYYAADLRKDLDAEIKYTGSRTIEVTGKVTKVSPVAEVEKTTSGETTSIPVEIEVPEPGTVIRPGFSVDVKVVIDSRENICLVPILAIEEDDDLSYIYIVGEDGTLEKRQIDQGLSDGLYIEANNVSAGEMIVSTTEEFLEDGLRVSYEKIGDQS